MDMHEADRLEFESQKNNSYWAGRLIGFDQAWEVADEIILFSKNYAREALDLQKTLNDEWFPVSALKPPHAVKVEVQHETSNGKDLDFGFYDEGRDKWFYFRGSWKDEDSIEVTHWKYQSKKA